MMDCGPASLKCLLDGHGIPVQYGRLREACQTDVDGTSIDVLEEVAESLGLPVEQIICPVDNLLLDEAAALPALAVVWLPGGGTHFVVVWRTVGRFVQVMDPAVGRVWMSRDELRRALYEHDLEVPADEWFDWATGDEFCGPIVHRLAQSGLSQTEAARWVTEESQDLERLCALDAASRWMSRIASHGGRPERLLQELTDDPSTIPSQFWAARKTPDGVWIRGAVCVRVLQDEAIHEPDEELPQALSTALAKPGPHLVRRLSSLVREDGLAAPLTLLGLGIVAGIGATAEALVFMSVLELGRYLAVPEQRLAAGLGALAFVALLGCWQFATSALQRWMGRRLEVRIRQRFREVLPRLEDRYFRSRLVSDMAERAHALRALRDIPAVGVALVATAASLVATTAGLIWLAPHLAVLPIAATVLAVTIPLVLQPAANERDLRVRTHVGALSRFYLDAMLGLQPIRTHGAEKTLEREHESLVTEWMRATLSLLRVNVGVSGVTALSGILIASALVFAYIGETTSTAGLLVVYWALAVPALAEQFAAQIRRYPVLRNVLLRTTELLDGPARPTGGSSLTGTAGISIEFEGVDIVAGGQTILEDISLQLEPGEHVAVVGRSGAGKSTLLSAILGTANIGGGRLLIDGASLEEVNVDALRLSTAWIDPSAQIWNRTLLQNLLFGSPPGGEENTARLVDLARLRTVLEQLPDGLQTVLGEGGTLVSGGEGQRVRIGRAVGRADARLALVDEGFRGLDRAVRDELRSMLREQFADATMLCVTHEIDATLDFDRVLVIDDGQVAEFGRPDDLREAGGVFATLLADAEAARNVWSDEHWRRIELQSGSIIDEREPFDAPDVDPLVFLDVPQSTAPESFVWPMTRAAECIETLIRPDQKVDALVRGGDDSLVRWFELVGATCGFDAQHITPRYDELDHLLSAGSPMVLVVESDGSRGLMAVVSSSRRHVKVLGPDGLERRPRHEIRRLIQSRLEGPLRLEFEQLAARTGADDSLVSAMLSDQLATLRCTHAWIIRPPAHAPLRDLLGAEGTWSWLRRLIAAHVARHAIFIAAWWLIGAGLLSGTLDFGMLLGWALAMATTVPLAALANLYQGMTALSASTVVKRRLLAGSFGLPSDILKREGSGHLLARIFESEALESLAMSGGLIGAFALVELASAAIVLGFSVGPVPLVALLLWIAAGAALIRHTYGRQVDWTDARRNLTHDLVERMVGHRTRLIQERPEQIHTGEDDQLSRYLSRSFEFDRLAVLSGLLGRGWLIVGGLALGPALLAGASTGAIAAGLGGILLARQAFGSIASAGLQLGAAKIAWTQAGPLFEAGGTSPEIGATSAREAAAERQSAPGDVIVDAHEVLRQYEGSRRPALDGSLEIQVGEQLLVTGPSGSGKSTLARLLAGLDTPDGGLLMLDGLDRETLGLRAWRDRVVAVPQFHENHIISGPLALNLLMGGDWPAGPDALARARSVCEELGLGPMLDRMPGGLLQMVGDTGWQLSHGERSRVFIARALLQNAELVVFDEAFSALDPQTLITTMSYVRASKRTMLVVAHP